MSELEPEIHVEVFHNWTWNPLRWPRVLLDRIIQGHLKRQLVNLRYANENLKNQRDEWEYKYHCAKRCLNSARCIIGEIAEAVEGADEATNLDDEIGKETIDRYSKIINMSNEELAS